MLPISFVLLIFALLILTVLASGQDSKLMNDGDDYDTDHNDKANGFAPKSKLNHMKAPQQAYERKDYDEIAKRIVKASRSDKCGWDTNVIDAIKGSVCGSHYKVLGLRRHSDPFQFLTKDNIDDGSTENTIDDAEIKKVYRKRMQALNADKEPSIIVEEAKRVLQEAHDCLTDSKCRSEYDHFLDTMEETAALNRNLYLQDVSQKALSLVNHSFYYLGVLSHMFLETSSNLWDVARDLKVTTIGGDIPIGQIALILAAAFIGKPFLVLSASAYVIVAVTKMMQDSVFS